MSYGYSSLPHDERERILAWLRARSWTVLNATDRYGVLASKAGSGLFDIETAVLMQVARDQTGSTR